MLMRLFYASATLLMLAATYNLGTRSAGASNAVVMPTEVATMSGMIADGQTIPLPTHADGTIALESECAWTLGSAKMMDQYGGLNYCYTANGTYYLNSGDPSFPSGRVVNCYWTAGRGDRWGSPANYLIVATRGASLPTTARNQSFGAVKAKYR